MSEITSVGGLFSNRSMYYLCCESGPNIRIIMNKEEELVEHGIDPAAVLELADPELRIHPTLLTACKVMEQAQQGMYDIRFDQKKKWLQYI